MDEHWFGCIGVDVESSSLYKANGGCDWGTSAHGWEQKLPECPEPPAGTNPPAGSCTLPSPQADLGQLFQPLSIGLRVGSTSLSTTIDSLSSKLNMSNFFLWQMSTVLNMNIDTGSHNYCECCTVLTEIESCFCGSRPFFGAFV